MLTGVAVRNNHGAGVAVRQSSKEVYVSHFAITGCQLKHNGAAFVIDGAVSSPTSVRCGAMCVHFHCDVRPCARPSSITLSSRRHALVAIQAFAITGNVLYGNYNDSHVAAVKGVDEPAPVVANNVGLTVT
jgi:hypothetical protein